MAARTEVNGAVALPGALGTRPPETLVREAAGGCEAAFEALVRAYERRVHGFAFRYVHDPHEAQDLAQEIFLRLYSRLDRFEAERPFEPWFWRLAAHVCLNYVRRKRAQPEAVAETNGSHLATPVMPEETPFGSAFVTLPPRERLLLLLYYHAGVPIEEIASSFGIGVPALRSRLHRARAQLRRALAGTA